MSNPAGEGALILSGQKVAELEAKLAAARQTQREIATRARVNGMSLRRPSRSTRRRNPEPPLWNANSIGGQMAESTSASTSVRRKR